MSLGMMLMHESIIWLTSTKFNKSTLGALDATFHSLEQNVGKDLTKLNSHVNLIQETYVASINDVLTYVAFFLAICRPRYHDFTCMAHHQLYEVVLNRLIFLSRNSLHAKIAVSHAVRRPERLQSLLWSVPILYILKVKSDHRSKFSNLSNWKEEA